METQNQPVPSSLYQIQVYNDLSVKGQSDDYMLSVVIVRYTDN